MKKYAESIKAEFSKREKGWFFEATSSFLKFNIITGKYNGQPLEIYHYKLSFAGARGPYYHTYINGKSYDGLLSVQEISKILILTGGDRTVTDRLPKMGLSKIRRSYPW